jgi:hypothetical protein
MRPAVRVLVSRRRRSAPPCTARSVHEAAGVVRSEFRAEVKLVKETCAGGWDERAAAGVEFYVKRVGAA